MSEHHWLSCTKMTIYAQTDGAGIITATAPIARKFVGQKIDRLAGWMSSFGGFEMAELAVGAGQRAGGQKWGGWIECTRPKPGWRVRLRCVFRDHDSHFREHVHRLRDLQWCLRCRRFWTRDGCGARQCGPQGGGE